MRVILLITLSISLSACNSLLGISSTQSCFSLRDHLLESPETLSYLESWVDSEINKIVDSKEYELGHFGMYPGDAKVSSTNIDASKLSFFPNGFQVSLNLTGNYWDDTSCKHVTSINFAERSRTAILVKRNNSKYYFGDQKFPRKQEGANRYLIDISSRIAVLCDF